MKLLILAISLAFAFTAEIASAKVPSVRSCMTKKNWIYFAHEMEEIAKENKTPILLMNDEDQVVGLISVSPERDEEHSYKATNVQVEKVVLCGDFEVTDFYYADDSAANLLEWVSAKKVYVTQDEGQVVINATVGENATYATRIDVDFKAYDVMTDIESYTAADRKSADFINDWGLPKGAGKFHFFIPANWKLVP